MSSLAAANLRCFRDPECRTHPYHGGHIQFLGTVDPRKAFKTKQRWKRAGRRAALLVRKWEETGPWRIALKLTPLQRRHMIGELKIALEEGLPR